MTALSAEAVKAADRQGRQVIVVCPAVRAPVAAVSEGENQEAAVVSAAEDQEAVVAAAAADSRQFIYKNITAIHTEDIT